MFFNAKVILPVATTLAMLFTSISAAPIADDASVENVVLEHELVERADSPTYTSDSSFKFYMLAAHNWYRGQHSAVALTWSDTLANQSGTYAGKCAFKHSGARGVGENLALGYPNVPGVVNGWGGERIYYNYSAPGFSSKTGHFTQLVWKRTTSFGCGRKKCSGGRWIVVCQYSPQGNILPNSNFRTYVGAQTTGKPTDKYVP